MSSGNGKTPDRVVPKAAEALRGVGDLDAMPRSQALKVLVNAGVAVEQAGPRRRLEDAFLQLVGEETP